MSRRRRWGAAISAAVLAATLTSVAAPAVAGAAPGDLDASFGGDGVVDLGSSRPDDIVVAPDGKVVVASGSRLRRFLPDGSPDPTFSDDGAMDYSPRLRAHPVRVAVAGDGTIAVASYVYDSTENGAEVYRVTPTGALDPAFGDGGRVFLGGAGWIFGAAFQPDGDLVVSDLGTLFRVSPDGGFEPQLRPSDVLRWEVEVDALGRVYSTVDDERLAAPVTILRFEEDLARDLAFGDDGRVEIPLDLLLAGTGLDPANASSRAQALDAAPDGSVLVAVNVADADRELTVLVRLTPEGAPDQSFAGDGVAVLPTPGNAAGKIWVSHVEATARGGAVVVAGIGGDQWEDPTTGVIAWQVRPDGALEPAFGDGGALVRTDPLVRMRPHFGAAAVDHDRLRLYLGRHQSAEPALGAIVAVAIAPAPPPVPPGPPTQPVVLGAPTAYTLSWGPPTSLGDAPLTGYVLRAYEPGAASPMLTVPTAAGVTSIDLRGLVPLGRLQRFLVAATSGSGESPGSPPSAWALPPFATVPGFVGRQFVDFVGRAPTAAERTSLADRVEAGTTVPGAAVAEVAGMAPWSLLDGVTRLYYAYFGRIPDGAGLRYWHGRRVGGSSLYQVSKSFAASSEFRSRYGALTNQGFVELVYQNVLDRAGDPGGIAYWTAELDSGRRTRGGVMVGFSESAEHKARKAGEVAVVSAFLGMLDQVPSSGQMSALEPDAADHGITSVAASILQSTDYRDRIGG